jgi:hypothetical protein
VHALIRYLMPDLSPAHRLRVRNSFSEALF